MGGCHQSYTNLPLTRPLVVVELNWIKWFTLPPMLLTVSFSLSQTHAHTLAYNILKWHTKTGVWESSTCSNCSSHCPVLYCKRDRNQKVICICWIHQHKPSIHLFRSPCEGAITFLKASSKSKLVKYEERQRQQLKAQTINFPGESVCSAWSDLSLTRLERRRQAWWTNEILEYSSKKGWSRIHTVVERCTIMPFGSYASEINVNRER